MQTANSPNSPPSGMTIANQELISLTVAGNSADPVTINNMIIYKTCRKPPPGGTIFYSPTTGAGPFMTAPIYFNLDEAASIGQYYPNAGSSIPAGGNFFDKEVITLRYHEPQTFSIWLTSSRYCTFTFDLNVATVNGHAVQHVTDNGHPFTITSDGEKGFADSAHLSFASYAIVYAGGSADQQHNGRFIRVNPATYHGSGDPMSFPVS